MRLLAALCCALVSLLVVTALMGGIAVADAPGVAYPSSVGIDGTGDHAAQLETVDVDLENATGPVQIMDLQLTESGDADWTITVWLPLDDEEDERAFERLADEFERNSGQAVISIGVFETAAAASASHNDRPMEITNVSRTTATTNTSGALSLAFTWTNFTVVGGHFISLGDVFDTGDGTWLPTLEDGQHLVIRAPDGYAVDSASTPVREGTMHVEGPTTLEAGDIESTYVPSSDGVSTPPSSPTPTPTPNDTETIVGGIALAIAGVLGLLFLVRRWDAQLLALLPAGIQQRVGDWGAGDGTVASEETTPGDEHTPAFPDAPPTAVDVDDAADEEGAFANVDFELLSDEERVIHLLEHNGGRMKQASIVKETDWSNAKVSQLLSSMAEEGTVEKLRIGRENLITLVDRDGELDAPVGDRG